MARAGDTLVLALVVEVHPEGAVLPLLVLSDAPGLLGWDPGQGLRVPDDAGREYEIGALAQQAGLGALQTAVWIEPAPPPEARRLHLEATSLMRTAVAPGGGASTALAGEASELEIDLVPAGPPSSPRPAAREAPEAAPRTYRRAPSAAFATSCRSARRGWPRARRSASGPSSPTRTRRS